MSQSSTQLTISQAYEHCMRITRGHYENFPVASWFLPAHIRQPISVIYAFARTADDFADEGDLAQDERLQKLNHYDELLTQISENEPVDDPIFIALKDVIQQYSIPVQLFHDLLTAFKQDVTKTRYENFGEVMQYCRYSANPVGRLLLHLYGETSEKSMAYSDAVCSALQLINFYQDIGQDFDENNRIYLPLDEMKKHGVELFHLEKRISDAAMQNLMRMQIERAMKLLQSGAPLGKILKGRIGLEIRMVILGGSKVAEKLANNMDDLFTRPRLTRWNMLNILMRSLVA